MIDYQIGDCVKILPSISNVNLIYMDPPYCTGRDFHHFNDVFNSTSEYRDQFMKPVIQSCYNSLDKSGIIVIHVESKISHHIRFLCDEIFGESHFVNEIIWLSGGNHHSTKQLQRSHDVIVVYRKGKSWTYNPEYLSYSQDY